MNFCCLQNLVLKTTCFDRRPGHLQVIHNKYKILGHGEHSRYSDSLLAGRSVDRTLWEGGGQIFCTRPDRPYGPASLLLQCVPSHSRE